MDSQSHPVLRSSNHAMLAVAVAALAACGGGGSTDPVAEPAPPATLSGTVAVNGLVQNAVVCLDLDASNTCDAGEPKSAKTGADGAYRLSFDPAVVTPQQVAAASLIAPQVPGAPTDGGTTIDTADGVATADTAYVLRQVPGKAGQINPLTTLVSAGVAAGMTQADARDNAAKQMGIAAAKIDNYQDDPAFTEAVVVDNARLMAMLTAATLEEGVPLSVGVQDAAFASIGSELRSLSFTDTNNFSYTEIGFPDKPAGTPGQSLTDVRVGKTGGVDTSGGQFNQAYLTADGWQRCDTATPLVATRGTPNRVIFCNAQQNAGARGSVSIEGRRMDSVVPELQAGGSGLLAALGATTFPVGSASRPGSGVNLNRPIFINSLNTDGQPQTRATTLEQLVAARPAANVDLSNSFGSLSLGSISATKGFRVAFLPVAGTVQFYECDWNVDQTALSNCNTNPGTGTYSISAISTTTRGEVRVMRFAGHAPTFMGHTRLYVEVKAAQQVNGVIGGGDWVFQAREAKPDLASNLFTNNRLNGVAWAAMKAQLGL